MPRFAKGARRSPPRKILEAKPLEEHPLVKARLEAHRSGASILPDAFDLSKFQPPVLDQGPTGSCTAHAAAGSIATSMAAAGTPLGYVPSPDLIYKTERAVARAAATPAGQKLAPLTDSGADLADGNTAVRAYGIAPMQGPTPDGRNSDIDPSTVNLEPDFARLEQAADKPIDGAYYINPGAPGAVEAICAAIAAGVAVRDAFWCDVAFENLQPGQVAGAPVVNQSDPNEGGHSTYYSAYRTNAQGKRELRKTNSWGLGWCDQGNGWVSEDHVLASWEAWAEAVAHGGGAS